MAAWCRSRGTTLLGYLEEIQRAHGLYLARQFNTTLPGATGAATIQQVMEAFRGRPPSSFGAWAIRATNDYQTQRRSADGHTSPLGLPKSNVLAWELEGGGRVTLRPSGTEPKLKVYFELKETMGPTEALREARGRGTQRLGELETNFLTEAHRRGLPT